MISDASWFSLKRFVVALLTVGLGAALGLEFVPLVGLYVGTLAAGYSPEEVSERLLDTAEDIGTDDDEQGAGLLDVAAALGYGSADDGTGDGTACPV